MSCFMNYSVRGGGAAVGGEVHICPPPICFFHSSYPVMPTDSLTTSFVLFYHEILYME